MKKLRINLFFLLCCVLFLALSSTEVLAQSKNFGITLSPPVRYLTVPSGTTQTTTVVLKNTTSAPLTLALKILDFSPDSETGHPVLGEPAPIGLVKITTPSEGTLSLQPGESSTVYVKITAPSGTQQKEYHWSLVALAEQSDVSPGSAATAQVVGGLASNLIVFFGEPGKVPITLAVDKPNVPKTVDSLQDLPFSFSLRNTGPQATIATGSATIENAWFPDQTATLPLYPDTVLASSSRPARTTDAQPFLLKKPFLFGLYTIKVSLDEKGENSIIIGQTLAFPWSIIVALILGWMFFVLIKNFSFKKMLNYFLQKPPKQTTLNDT